MPGHVNKSEGFDERGGQGAYLVEKKMKKKNITVGRRAPRSVGEQNKRSISEKKNAAAK